MRGLNKKVWSHSTKYIYDVLYRYIIYSSVVVHTTKNKSEMMLQTLSLLIMTLSVCVALTPPLFTSLSKEQRKKMKDDFKLLASNHNEPAWGCSDFEHIFLAMRQADPSGDKLFIDVGFNKG
jgi:hypothetical protein